MDITGKKLFVKALKAEGVDTVFAYPGGVITDLLDELNKTDIRLILPRHEQALIHEAEGYARATGKAAVCLVTSGPGATNTITGLADAFYDSIPLVVFTGQVARGLVGNDAFQEIDMMGITRNITKYGIMVPDRPSLGRIIKEAFFVSQTGKPGPVVIDFPKDIQNETGDSEYPESVSMRGYKPSEGVHIGQLKKAWKMLKNAKKPLILAGGGVNIARANAELIKFAEKTKVPVMTTIMGKGAMPSDHPLYLGNAGMHGKFACNKAVNECDVLFSIGTRFNDRITGSLSSFAPNAQIIHIDIDTASISRNVVVNVPIVADAKLALSKINEWATKVDTAKWMEEIKKWDEKYPMSMPNDVGLTPQVIMKTINEVFDGETIFTADVGQNQMWATQFIDLKKGKMMITSGGLGTMGFGFPAAVGAKIGAPKKDVVCVTGDGGFQMNMQEMATSIVEGAPVTVILLNNAYLGMVRQMQQMFYGKRYVHTSLKLHGEDIDPNAKLDAEKHEYVPDFIKWAESYGALGIRVTEREDVKSALEKAKANKDTTTVIEFIIEPEEVVLPMVKGGSALDNMIL
ncbi:MAG: biosynthetic-type acetolactate synthase large subunit [Eubacterium sp.]|nr:biosynthetic-type acetolactate synthase large subunit [Eubacterium sp.]